VLLHVASVPGVSLFAYGIAKNWVAGKSIADVLLACKRANAKGFGAIANYLGEEIERETEVEKSLAECKRLLGSLDKERIDGAISIKLTQLGLSIDKRLCVRNLSEIVEHADEFGRFVWVDMESSRFTDDTLDTYASILSKSRDVGVCVQSYLRRSMGDVERLVKLGGKIRLVKGAYNEPASVAFKSRVEVDRSFLRLMEFLFMNSRELFSVSTHDDNLVYKAVELNERFDRCFEFGMLKGVRDKLKLELVRKGFRVTEYIPYGENWLPYSIRRIREKPSNVLLLARSLISK
jgi:proline dehydrogenase